MSDENPDDLIVLHGVAWERLPDGTYQLLVECPTIVHYVTLPKTLCFGRKLTVYKAAWDSGRKNAYYRELRIDLSMATEDSV